MDRISETRSEFEIFVADTEKKMQDKNKVNEEVRCQERKWMELGEDRVQW